MDPPGVRPLRLLALGQKWTREKAQDCELSHRKHLDDSIASLGSAYTHSHNSGHPIIPRLSHSIVREWETPIASWPSPQTDIEMETEDLAVLFHNPYAKNVLTNSFEPTNK